MWVIEDLTRDGTGPRRGALIADGVELCDAVERVRWAEPALHLFHCDHCGGDDRTGGWVSPRRAGDRVLWLPAFAQMGIDDAWAREEYGAPSFLRERGIAVFAYDALAAVIPGFPVCEAIAPLTMRDAALALQLESVEMLGVHPEAPTVKRPWVLSSSDPSFDEVLERFDAMLRACLEDDRPAELVTADEGVWFWVDPGVGREWRPLARRRADELLLRFEPDLAIAPVTKR